MLLMIDNYDSFTYNLVQYLRELGQEVEVFLNDKINIATIQKLAPQYIVISPGPCDPDQAGISIDVINTFAGNIPILGVCLGHQCIAQAFGGRVINANEIMHGRTSAISHNNQGVFHKLPNPMTVTRYHSLVAEKSSLPECLEVTAWTAQQENKDSEIMGIKHKTLSVEGVQFHPESILSESGHALLENFIKRYA